MMGVFCYGQDIQGNVYFFSDKSQRAQWIKDDPNNRQVVNLQKLPYGTVVVCYLCGVRINKKYSKQHFCTKGTLLHKFHSTNKYARNTRKGR